MTARTLLAGHMKDQAEWRTQKADEHPGDRRNSASAAALLSLSAQIETLPDEDPRLQRLDRIVTLCGGVLPLGEQSSSMVSRYGFNLRAKEDGGKFISSLIETMAAELPDADADPHGAAEMAMDRDTTLSLAAIGTLREWLDVQEDDAVARARAEGMSWGRIGELLGRSRQAVWEKYS